MRGLVFGVAAVLAGAAPAADDPAAVVDRAIAAAGGAGRLADIRAATWKTAGAAQGRPSRGEFHGQLPDKFRIDGTRVVDGAAVRWSRIISGEAGWVVLGDKVTPMTPEEIAGVRATFYFKQLATTLVPLKEPGCKLTAGGRADVNGKPTTVVKAARAGFPDATLYFDRDTGLLAKAEMTGAPQSDGAAGRKVELEFSDYKEFDGMKLAGRTKTYHDGKLFLDTELVEFKKAARLPDETFRAP